jgi:hypothetical protein
MTTTARPTGAADFVRRPGVATIEGLDAELCGWLFRRPEFRALRIAARGAHPRAYSALLAIAVLGNEWADLVNANAQREPTRIPPPSNDQRMTAHEAAAVLHVTPDRVRQLCRTGQLEAENQGRPFGWQISREALAHYQTRTRRTPNA